MTQLDAPVPLWKVPALQLELTKTPKSSNQTCAAMKMLKQLHELGFKFKQVNNKIVDEPAPPTRRRAPPCTDGGRAIRAAATVHSLWVPWGSAPPGGAAKGGGWAAVPSIPAPWC